MPSSADTILREAFVSTGIEGASTHSFRRTALTQMSNAGIALRVIQEISGHSNLEQLQGYLEVRQEQVPGAIASLSMLSYTGKLYYPTYPINSQPHRCPHPNCHNCHNPAPMSHQKKSLDGDARFFPQNRSSPF